MSILPEATFIRGRCERLIESEHRSADTVYARRPARAVRTRRRGKDEVRWDDAVPSVPAVDFEGLDCSTEFGSGRRALSSLSISRTRTWSSLAITPTQTGVAIGQGLGNATDVVPGQTYRHEVLYR